MDRAFACPGHKTDMARVSQSIRLVLRRFAAVVFKDEQEGAFRHGPKLCDAILRRHNHAVVVDFPVPCVAAGKVFVAPAVPQALLHKRLTVHRGVWCSDILESNAAEFIAVYHANRLLLFDIVH